MEERLRETLGCGWSLPVWPALLIFWLGGDPGQAAPDLEMLSAFVAKEAY